MSESGLQREIRLHLGQKPDLVIWRQNVGRFNVVDGAGDRWVECGLCKGSSDLIGILAPRGRFFALEVKTGRGRETEEQKFFIALVIKVGGYAGVARSVEEAEAHYQRARNGVAPADDSELGRLRWSEKPRPGRKTGAFELQVLDGEEWVTLHTQLGRYRAVVEDSRERVTSLGHRHFRLLRDGVVVAEAKTTKVGERFKWIKGHWSFMEP